MKRIVLVVLILMAVLTAGVVPQVVYGAEEEKDSKLTEEDLKLLTPEEQAFRKELNKKYYEIFSVYNNLGIVTYEDSNRIAEMRDYLASNPPDCSMPSSPSVFADVRAKWNSEVCPDVVTMYDTLVSIFNDEELIEHPDWTAVRSQLNSRLDKLQPKPDRIIEKALEVSQMADDRAEDLIDRRKELREKAEKAAKDLLKNGDKGDNGDSGGNGGQKAEEDSEDSEDLFDTDCFIATAAYGTPEAGEIDTLRQFRDEFLVNYLLGREFVAIYYTVSPPIASIISEHEALRFIVREGFVAPVVTLLELTECCQAE